MMKKRGNIGYNIKELISSNFLNSTIKPIFLSFVSILCCLEILSLELISWYSINTIATNSLNLINDQNLFINIIQALIFTFEVVLLGVISRFVFKKKNIIEKMDHKLQQQNYVTIISRKLIPIGLLLIRKILLIPILIISLTVLFNLKKYNSVTIFFAIGNLLLLSFNYIFSGISFWNRLVISKNILSYAYKINVQSLIYVYLPFRLLLECISPHIVCYFNLVFSILYISLLYFRPLITFKHGSIILLENSISLSILLSRALLEILDFQISRLKQQFFIIVIILTVFLYLFQTKRISSLLFYVPSNTLYSIINSKINSWSFNEILFYHISNYQNSKNQLILFSLSLITKNTSVHQIGSVDIKSVSQKSIIEQKLNIFEPNKHIFTIINKIKDQSTTQNELKSSLINFIRLIYTSQYNPYQISIQNIGKMQLTEKLTYASQIYLFIAQILMIEQKNHKDCIKFLQNHQFLQQKIYATSLITQAQIQSLKSIIRQNYRINHNNDKNRNLNVEKYYQYEQKTDQIKRLMDQSCENRSIFWNQSIHSEPKNKNIEKNIKNDYFLHRNIQNICFQILKTQKCSFGLFVIVCSYAQIVLNLKLSEKSNSFCCMIIKLRQNLLFQNKKDEQKQCDSQLSQQQKQKGVCLVNIEDNIGNIEWGNQCFWTQFYQIDNKKINQQKKSIFDMIIPAFRSHHVKQLQEITYSSSELNDCPQNTFLYNDNKKIIEKIQLKYQLFSSLINGFSISIFLQKDSKIPQTSNFTIFLRKDYRILTYTKQFQEQMRYFIQDQSSDAFKSNKYESDNYQILSQNLIENSQFTNLLNVSNMRKSVQNRKQNDNKINFEIGNMNYTIFVQKRYQINQVKPSQQKQIIFIYKLNFKKEVSQNIQNIHTIQSLKQQQNIQSLKQQKDIQKHKKDYYNNKSNDNKYLNSYSSSINSQNITRLNIHTGNMIQYKVQNIGLEQQYTTTKNEQLKQVQKNYEFLIKNKTPKKIKLWIFFTITIILLLAVAMITNVIIFKERKSIYEQIKYTIKYYNQLITDVTQIIIALRQYNYYAYLYGPEDPHIPNLIKQVNQQQSQVQYKLNYLSKYLHQKWQAIQISAHGQVKYIMDTSYVVIANYMLSSITYISEIKPQLLSFPIVYKQLLGKQFDTAQINYFQAIFNGIYVVLDNLSNERDQFLAFILKNITDLSNKSYIYPCIAGIGLLIVFGLISILIQRKSFILKQTTINLLNQVSFPQRSQKMKQIKQWKQNHQYYSSTYEKLSNSGKDMNIQRTISNAVLNFKNIQCKQTSQKKTHHNSELLKQVTDNYPNTQQQQQTKRQFGQMQGIDIFTKTRDKNQPQSQTKPKYNQLTAQKSSITLKQSKISKFSLIFYLLVCIPSLVYFITILIGGFQMDNKMQTNFQMSFQIYNKKSNQQLVFLLTRQIFYVKTFIKSNQNWANKTMNAISSTLLHNRKLDKMIAENDRNQNLQQVVKMLQNQNLCMRMNLFTQSDYYDVKFTQEQCESISNNILTHGLKSAQNWFIQISTYLLNQYPNPSELTIQQKYTALKSQQLLQMKRILAYLEVCMDMMNEALAVDLQEQINSYINLTLVYSGISIACLVIFFYAINYRWKILQVQRKQIKTIISLISMQSIKKDSILSKDFNQIDFSFYK